MGRRLAVALLLYLIVAAGATWALGTAGSDRSVAGGVRREVFEGAGFSRPALQVDAVVPDISLAFLDEHTTLPRRYFSVRWSGHWDVGEGGYVDLYAGGDDRLAVIVDGRTVLQRDQQRGTHTTSRPLFLGQGLHSLVVEYEQEAGYYGVNVQWAPTEGRPREFDRATLYPARPDEGVLQRRRTVQALGNLVVPGVWLVPPLILLLWRAYPHVRRPARRTWDRAIGVVRARPAWSVCALIVCAGVALRLGALFVVTVSPGFEWIDPDGYLRQAELLTSNGETWRWTLDAVRYQEFFKAPAYPVFLSAFTFLGNGFRFSAAVAQTVLVLLCQNAQFERVRASDLI